MDLTTGGGKSKNKNLMFIFAIVIVLILMMDLWFIQKMILLDKCKREHLHAVQSHGGTKLKYLSDATFMRNESDFEKKEGKLYNKYYL